MKNAFASGLHLKEAHPGVVLALQADARNHPGGLPAIAEITGRNYGTLRNMLCPTFMQQEPPLSLVIDVIELTGGRRTVPAIAQTGNQTALPLVMAGEGTPDEVARAFLDVVGRAGKLEGRTVEALADRLLVTRERVEMVELADDMIRAALQFRALASGG